MKAWFEAALASCRLSEEQEGYVVGRGLTFNRVADLGVVGWDADAPDDFAPDEDFRERHGGRGQRLDGNLAFPLRSPTGELIGVEFRRWDRKQVSQHLLPPASWNPVFVGLTPSAMRRLWDGGDVWIVEGVFDMGAMENVVPSRDVVLGTLRARLSDAHVDFLRRFCRGKVFMVYDNDETGRKQTHGYVDEEGKHRWGALRKLERVKLPCRDVPYTGGKDPGQIWEQTGTPGLRRAFGTLFQPR